MVGARVQVVIDGAKRLVNRVQSVSKLAGSKCDHGSANAHQADASQADDMQADARPADARQVDARQVD